MIDEYDVIRQEIKLIYDMSVYDDEIPTDADAPSCAIRQMPSGNETRVNCDKVENVYSVLFRMEHAYTQRLLVTDIFKQLRNVKGFRTSNFNPAYRDEQNRFYYEFTITLNL